jgi:hypothetical protein
MVSGRIMIISSNNITYWLPSIMDGKGLHLPPSINGRDPSRISSHQLPLPDIWTKVQPTLNGV